jgi:lysozyme
MHFTGKHWDTESNLDDFGARYYSSGMARWVTPDWSARQEAVPYVDMDNPQSLNLYAYVGNNPTTDTDASGHDRWSQAQQNGGCWFQRTIACAEEGPSSTSNDSNSPSTDSPDKPTAQNQTLSGKGLQFIEKHEGYSDTVYKDSAGNPTIGFGHLIKDGEDFSKGITKEKAEELLAQDTKTAVDAVNSNVTASLSQTKFDAVVDFTYNLGGANLEKSTLLKNINAGNDVTKENFTDWNHAGGKVVNGLTARRTDEFNLFSKGDYGGP